MIPVTKPYLPSQNKYKSYLIGIWNRNWLTNNGPLVNEFETKLKTYLNVDNLLYVSNGTIALQLAIKALGLKGEIITTPFSYVATTSSIVWEGCKPVFVDIDTNTWNIDPSKIEAAITTNTMAILATHCFGNACNIDAIQSIADRHGLKVIYDAAHCFGTSYKGKSIFEFGDICTISLHATKLMHSVEGGLVITKSKEVISRLAYMRNFGHDGPEKFNGVGINGKNSEFHAAMGLCVLDDIKLILKKRKEQSEYYDYLLSKLSIQKQSIQLGCDYNYAYYPVLFSNEEKMRCAIVELEKKQIYPRRYFYPSLVQLDYVSHYITPVAESVSLSILCLPLYHELTKQEQKEVAKSLINI